MSERKLDMRYASDRAKARQRETAAPPLYRADLLRTLRDGRYNSLPFTPTGRKFGIEIRNLAAETDLSSGTIQAALKGEATKIETLKILADFFGIPWLALFDVDRKLEFDEDGNPSIADPVKKRKLKKGEIDLG